MFTNKSKTFGHTVKGNEPRTPPLSLPFILGRNLTLGGGGRKPQFLSGGCG